MATVKVWYLIKGAGEPHALRVPSGTDISELKDAIREQNPRKLGHLDANDLIIKSSPTSEALDPGNEVAQINGGKTSKTPLYVDFPGVKEPSGQVDMKAVLDALEKQRVLVEKQRVLVERVHDTLPKLIDHAFGLRPASHTSTFDPEFEQSLCDYYGMEYDARSCMILGQLFPECLRTYTRHTFWGPDYFLPVGQHIYHKGQHWDAKHIGIDVTNPNNGLLLMKSIEQLFQNGHITLIPQDADDPTEDKVELAIHVTRRLHTQQVMWLESQPPVPLKRPVLLEDKGKGKGRRATASWDGRSTSDITFADIHMQNISIRPPSMRSLYMHARMAYEENPELPNPDEWIHRYQGRCNALQQLLETMCLQPGNAEVEEVVVHNEDAVLETAGLGSSASSP